MAAKLASFYNKIIARPYVKGLFLLIIAVILFLLLRQSTTHSVINTCGETSKDSSVETPPKDSSVETPPKDSSVETPSSNDPSIETPPSNGSSIEIPHKDPYEEAIKHFSPFTSEYSLATCSSLPKNTHTQPRTFKAYGPPGRELSILHWRYYSIPTAEKMNWHKMSKELCPYPPELVPFFKTLYSQFAASYSPKVDEWPIGYAPCLLWYYHSKNQRVTCKNGQSYHIHANYTLWREADVIYMDYPFLFHQEEAPPFFHTAQMPPRRSNQAWWMNFPDEGLGYYPFVGLDTLRNMFDLTMGAPGDIFDIFKPTYPINKTSVFYNTRVKFENKRNDVLFAWMAGNCYAKNKREDYVRELMNHVKVHSYGTCLHNQDTPDEILKKYGLKTGSAPAYWADNMYKVKRDILSPYKFILAFENSNCEGYVTEKVYDPFLVDAIPIYMGASDINDYVPPGSVIKVTDFENITALVEHTEMIANNKTLYESYLAWKKDKTHKNFCKKCRRLDESNECTFLKRVEWVN
ncbi:11183_t:CDS:1 [Paraglomus brasilianum]|uniref:Fucosyltransferase n=1 Tax=Paraglomus brasilianum TaxID=144538 RepID=A0A9N9BY00_9GLOM|nr:11183_t:CDS:1 [Paraglomus brasilianum]